MGGGGNQLEEQPISGMGGGRNPFGGAGGFDSELPQEYAP